MMYVQEDWTQYRTLSALCRKAGVSQERLAALVAKEVTDDALDASQDVEIGGIGDRGFYVEDCGSGIPGEPSDVAHLYSIARPLTSSKVLRTPSRGRLGNGLRVVSGAVLATGGTLKVMTRGRALELTPRDDGTTAVTRVSPWDGKGTRVEVVLGPELEIEDDILAYSRQAIALGRAGGPRYAGRTSAWWYDADAFFELFQAAGERTVRDVVACFDGWAEPKAGPASRVYRGRAASSLTRDEARALLLQLREGSRRVKARRLGCVGRHAGPDAGYAKTEATIIYRGRDGISEYIPMVVEAWVGSGDQDDQPRVVMHVNRTPVVADVWASVHKNVLEVSGCGVSFDVPVGRCAPPTVWVNLETPYIPLTDDSKEPSLVHPAEHVIAAMTRAIRRAKRTAPCSVRSGTRTTKEVILDAIAAGIEKASGSGKHRYSLRQLFYAIRPNVLDELGKELDYGWFGEVITAHEAELGQDLPGMYRDARGVLFHPHTQDEIALGTLAVEQYERPAWTFKHVLYCEKEGLFPLLREAQFPERFDCALLTSKGFASRAARDVLDLLGESDEEIVFFAVHDADGYGTKIFESLQQGTRARPGRRVKVVNLGLEPAEARKMGLQVETFTKKKGIIPVAKYVPARDREWLQQHRVELNAMSTPQFIAWLERKFEAHAASKVVPPRSVLRAELREQTRAEVTGRLTAQILLEAKLEERVLAVVADLEEQTRTIRFAASLEKTVRARLDDEPELSWRVPIADRARSLAEAATESAINGKR